MTRRTKPPPLPPEGRAAIERVMKWEDDSWRSLGLEVRPRRCNTNYVGLYGECLACNADQGEACLSPQPRTPAEQVKETDK
jgi:hypothetical protein